MKLYGKIGYFRLVNIKVIQDDNNEPIYEGMVEDAPEYVKEKQYAKADMGNPMTLYVYSDEYIEREDAKEKKEQS